MRVVAHAGDFTLATRIAQVEAELTQLRQQQRDELIAIIAAVAGPGVAFSAAELWRHRIVNRDLAVALEDAGIRSPQQIGRLLHGLCGHGLACLGRENSGRLWIVSMPDDWH